MDPHGGFRLFQATKNRSRSLFDSQEGLEVGQDGHGERPAGTHVPTPRHEGRAQRMSGAELMMV